MRTLLVFALALSTSCGIAPPCTLIGCSNTITFTLTSAQAQQFGQGEPVSVKACIGTECVMGTVTNDQPGASSSTTPALSLNLTASQLLFTFTTSPSGPQSVTLELSKSGTVFLNEQRDVTLTASQPNGPACPPVCQQATVTL